MIIGHQKQWHYLKTLAEDDKLPHAILFAGPEKVGKKTLALELVKFIFKKEPTVHPDFHFILPQDNIIKINQIRELIWQLSLKPYSGKIKIGLIDNAHLMEVESQNALLKTLEEPKGDALLILISHRPNSLLRTILSRVQILRFFLIEEDEIFKYLVSLGSEKEKAQEIAKFSFGKVGWAVDFLNDPKKFIERKEELRDCLRNFSSTIAARFNYINKLENEEKSFSDILGNWQEYLRRVLISKIEGKNLLPNLSQQKIFNFLKNLEKTKDLIENTNANQKLAMENLMLSI